MLTTYLTSYNSCETHDAFKLWKNEFSLDERKILSVNKMISKLKLT